MLQTLDSIENQVFDVVVPLEGVPFLQWPTDKKLLETPFGHDSTNEMLTDVQTRIEHRLLNYIEDVQRAHFAATFGFKLTELGPTKTA